MENMMRGKAVRSLTFLAAMAVAAAGLSACGSKHGASDSAPTSEANFATTTTTTDPYAIPATIDEAYINKVMAALEHVRGDVRRHVYATQSISQADYDALDDIYDGDTLKLERQDFSDASEIPHNDAKPNPGDEIVQVTSIRASKPSCIAFENLGNTDAITKSTMPPSGPWITVLFKVPSSHGHNPTPWKIELDELAFDEKTPYQC